MKKNVLIMAGGTGGHVIPALSVAKHLKQKGYQVHWLGSIQGIENDLVPDAGYELHRISISGLRGNGLLKKLLAPFQLLRALWQTLKVFMVLKPEMALGMGGFASGPGGLMAWLLKVPLVIHEQNAIAGMTNTILSKKSSKLLQAFEGTFDIKGVKTVGNPVRTTIANITEPTLRLENRTDSLNVLVVGGSLGAVAINDVLVETMAQLPDDSSINVHHQVGKRNFESVKQAYTAAGITNKNVKVSAFIADMAAEFSWADVVICRAGALTVCELMAAGVASILIPYPFAVDDHQTANARFLSDADAGLLCDQNEFTADYLINQLTMLRQNKSKLLEMSIAARGLAKPESAKVVANYCIGVMR
jgi:UDP-N-acetylglucosamine--N-acetylmuramyl-(pentapeptide) pyrophosphoryl-undecaprenol N-acetylglucosamine transferase